MTNQAGYPDRKPAQKPLIENKPARANAFGPGVATGKKAAAKHEQSPGAYGRKD